MFLFQKHFRTLYVSALKGSVYFLYSVVHVRRHEKWRKANSVQAELARTVCRTKQALKISTCNSARRLRRCFCCPQSSFGHSLVGLRQYCSMTQDWVLMPPGQEHPASLGTWLDGSRDMCQGLLALVCHKNRPRTENTYPAVRQQGVLQDWEATQRNP